MVVEDASPALLGADLSAIELREVADLVGSGVPVVLWDHEGGGVFLGRLAVEVEGVELVAQ
eukprot:9487518-Pyramimonas_sp.AAC.1